MMTWRLPFPVCPSFPYRRAPGAHRCGGTLGTGG